MARPFGTFKYDNLADLETDIDKYFSDCDAKPVLDKDGNQLLDKQFALLQSVAGMQNITLILNGLNLLKIK